MPTPGPALPCAYVHTPCAPPPPPPAATHPPTHPPPRSSPRGLSKQNQNQATSKPGVLQVVQFDDHMVHRGHAVFDTALLVESYLYQLDPHLDRQVAQPC